MKRIWMWAVCLSLLLFLGGCGKRQKEPSQEGIYQIYYLNTSVTKLVPMEYHPTAQQGDTKALIEELMQQFGQVPADFDGQTALGEKVSLQRYVLDETVLYLYFDPNYMLMDPTREILCRAALAKLFTQIPGIEYINIYSGDQPIVDARGNPVGMMCATDFIESISDVNGFEEFTQIPGIEYINIYSGDQPIVDARGNPVGMMCATDFIESISDVNGFEESELTLYFTDESGNVLRAEKRQVIHSINTSLERLVIEELIFGPEQEGLMPTLPPETKLLNISTNDNICYVNFDSSFLKNSLNVKEYIPVYSIVNSLVENTDVNRVQILVNGASDSLLKEVFPLNRLFEQNMDYIMKEEQQGE